MTEEKKKPQTEVLEDEELEKVAGGITTKITKTQGDESGTTKGIVTSKTTSGSGTSSPDVVVEPDGTVKVPEK